MNITRCQVWGGHVRKMLYRHPEELRNPSRQYVHPTHTPRTHTPHVHHTRTSMPEHFMIKKGRRAGI